MTTKTKRMSALLLALVMVASLFTGQILPVYADEPTARESWEAVHSYTIFAPHVAGVQVREVYQYALGARAFSDGNTEVAYKFDNTYFVFATNRIGNIYYNLDIDGVKDRLVSGGEGLNPAQTFVPVVYDNASRTYLAGPYFTVDNQEFYYMDAPVSNSQGATGDGDLQGPETGALTDITVFYDSVTGDITETTPRLVPDTSEPPVTDPSIKGPDSQGNYYKPIGVPAHIYEVVTDNTTGTSKEPVEYILDTNSDGDNNPATNPDTNLSVEKYGDKYYVELPRNIYHEVGNDGTYDSETGTWGGSDGKLGGGNDEAAVKYGGGWYVNMGQNVFKPVSGSTSSALVGGGEDKNPATAPATPVYYHATSGKYFIGPNTDSDGDNFYYGDALSGNGLVDSESTGIKGDDIIWYVGDDGAMTTVKPTVSATSVILNKYSTSLEVGQSETISFSVLPAAAAQSVTWRTATPAVATVDASGEITAITPGTAAITAETGNGRTATVLVTVTPSSTTTALDLINLDDFQLPVVTGDNPVSVWDMNLKFVVDGYCWQILAIDKHGNCLIVTADAEPGEQLIQKSGGTFLTTSQHYFAILDVGQYDDDPHALMPVSYFDYRTTSINDSMSDIFGRLVELQGVALPTVLMARNSSEHETNTFDSFSFVDVDGTDPASEYGAFALSQREARLFGYPGARVALLDNTSGAMEWWLRSHHFFRGGNMQSPMYYARAYMVFDDGEMNTPFEYDIPTTFAVDELAGIRPALWVRIGR